MGLARIIFFNLFLIQSVFSWQSKADFLSSDLPIVIIDTGGQDIPFSDPRIIANMNIIFNGEGQRNTINDPANNYSGKISIEIRGESSGGWDFKSYGFETQTADGSNRNVSLLGLPEENDWILHAPFYDRSLFRNALSYKLAREMGWYASRTVYCEVILNGEYQGIYLLMEKIKRDANRVDITTLSPDEISGDDVTGGYILRVDKEGWNPGVDSQYPPSNFSDITLRYQYVYPKAEDIAPEQETYIQNFMHDFEDLMYEGDFLNLNSDYVKYLNVDSFVDYLILNELSKNVDGYRLSSYLTKQKESNGGKLIAGPAWDYNFSFGNAGYYEAERTDGWQLLYFTDNESFQQFDSFQVPFWWKILFNDGKFRKQLRERWTELRKTTLSIDSLNNTMDHFASITAEARTRNFEIRPQPGSNDLGGGWFPYDPRNQEIESYEDELALTKAWIADRITWIDSNIHLLVANESIASPISFRLLQNYPNPFNPSTIITFELPKATHVLLNVYNLQGQITKQLLNEVVASGSHQVNFDSQGISSGIYFYSIEADNFRHTRKMLLIK
ncbi:MAG: CotH kinase family protein [Balneolaceae bacterium]